MEPYPGVMTDREALLALLERFALRPAVDADGKWPTDDRAVTLAAEQGGVEGYAGFIAVFRFDEVGEFESVHIWE